MSVTLLRQQRGLGLVELMVGIVISLIVMAGTVVVFLGNSESAIFHVRSTRFVQQMRDAMDRVVVDVRRAGYMGYLHAAAATPPGANPFNTYVANEEEEGKAATGVVAHDDADADDDGDADADGDCVGGVCPSVTYTYNLDHELNDARTALLHRTPQVGLAGGADCGADFDPAAVNELFGFRVNKTDSAAWILEMRTLRLKPADCADLRTGDWEPVTDPAIALLDDLPDPAEPGGVFRTGFSLSEGCYGYVDQNNDGLGSCSDPRSGDVSIWVRQVRVRLAGRSARNPEVTLKLSQVVDLPNYVSARVVP